MDTIAELPKERHGTLYFFTGLSGAGKTTIGGLFYRRLKVKKNDVVLLDGDQTRPVLKDYGYSTEARIAGAKQFFQLCLLLTSQGIDVVCCSISMYREIRAWNRAHFPHYREIYLKVLPETLYRRDQKGLYSGKVKEVVGVDLPWDEPRTSDFVIENDGKETPEQIVARLERAFGLEGRNERVEEPMESPDC